MRRSISAAYSVIGIIAMAILCLILILSYFLHWQDIFNTTEVQEPALRLAVQISAIFILLNFWFGLINSLLGALQKSSAITLNQTASSFLSLILVYILMQTTSGEIWKLAIAYGCALCAPNIISTLLLAYRYPKFRPKFCLKIRHWKSLLSVGSQFLIIQLAVMIIFLTDKILITQIFGPQYVTQYEVIFKAFSVITLAYALISTPLWSAYTDAHHRMDYSWIVSMLRKQLFIYAGVIFATILLCFFISPIIRIWIGEDFEISMSLVFAMAIFILISTWNNIFATLVNGIGRIKPQLYTAIFAMIINIPLAFLFTKYFNFGVSGVVIATCISLFSAAVILPLQVRLIFKEYSDAR
jgi:O-antigen/teichoic acid export membrane protein